MSSGRADSINPISNPALYATRTVSFRNSRKSGSISDAYRAVYSFKNMKPATVNRNAYGLYPGNSKISARIEELRDRHLKRHDISVDSLTSDAYKAIKLAEQEGQTGAYVSALQLIAKLHGLLTEKRELTGKGGEVLSVRVIHE